MIEIEGKQYEPREKQKPSDASKRMFMLMTTCLIMGGGMPCLKEPERPDVDIVMEFERIQQKKSILSRSERDWVEKQFKSNFREVSEEMIGRLKG